MESVHFRVVGALLLAVLVAVVSRCESGALPITIKCPQNVGPYDWPTFFAHTDYCTKYYMCVHGEPQEMDCAPGTVFNEQYNTCVHAGGVRDTCTLSHPVRECDIGTVDLIPHPGNCHHYYNCSSTRSQFYRNPLGPYGKECQYPYLFDIHRKQCVPYDQAVCGRGRKVPTWECQYVAFGCPVSHCIPCRVWYPSCVNKTDGLWAHEVKMWSPFFVDCQNQRSKNGEERCPSHALTGTYQIFHPDKRRCVSLWEIPVEHAGYEPSCDGKEDGFYISDGAQIVSYSCPDKQLFYCNPPLFVDSDINRCKPFHNNAAN